MYAQWMNEWVSGLVEATLVLMAPSCSLSNEEGEAGGSGVQGKAWVERKFEEGLSREEIWGYPGLLETRNQKQTNQLKG